LERLRTRQRRRKRREKRERRKNGRERKEGRAGGAGGGVVAKSDARKGASAVVEGVVATRIEGMATPPSSAALSFLGA